MIGVSIESIKLLPLPHSQTARRRKKATAWQWPFDGFDKLFSLFTLTAEAVQV